MLMVYFKLEKGKKMITDLSVGISIIAVLFLAMAKEPYATTVMFLLLLIKGGLFYRQAKGRGIRYCFFILPTVGELKCCISIIAFKTIS